MTEIPSREEIHRAYGMLQLYGWRELSQSEKEIIMFDAETTAFIDDFQYLICI